MLAQLASTTPQPHSSFGEVLGPHGWIMVASFLVTAVATPIVRWVAMRLQIVDKPDAFLKPHGRPVAYLGGVGIFLGWAAGIVMLMFQVGGHPWAIGVLAAGAVVMLVGLADDIYNIKPLVKMAGQTLAAVILLISGVGLHFLNVILAPFSIVAPEWVVLTLSVPISLFLVIAATNATNLLDGLDGLCSGVTAIISLCFLLLAAHLAIYTDPQNTDIVARDHVRIAVSLAMFGAVCGFLPYNSNPARIFMGDAGSLLLGLYSAAMILMFAGRSNPRWVLGAIMIFGLPILDTSLALLRRVRLHRPIFAGDRSHLYDQLVDRGFTVRQTVAICYALGAFYGAVGLAIMFFVRTRYALAIYAAVAVITLLICSKLGFLKPPATTAREQQQMHNRQSASG